MGPAPNQLPTDRQPVCSHLTKTAFQTTTMQLLPTGQDHELPALSRAPSGGAMRCSHACLTRTYGCSMQLTSWCTANDKGLYCLLIRLQPSGLPTLISTPTCNTPRHPTNESLSTKHPGNRVFSKAAQPWHHHQVLWCRLPTQPLVHVLATPQLSSRQHHNLGHHSHPCLVNIPTNAASTVPPCGW